ncbi:MAG: acetylornithine deacetylase [Gammaproteobacteria bacterium]
MSQSHPQLPAATRILGDLIAHQTEPPHGNLPMCDYVGGLLRAAGFACHTSRTADGNKESLFAALGEGANAANDKRRGVILSGHSDVVDASSQSGWQTPPFEMREKGGILFGRGACDMKGFLACVLASAPAFAKAKLAEPLYFALSRDEEVGCIGMPDILTLMRQAGAHPRLALVGEPTKMQVVAGHKSGAEMRTTFTGTEAHSSRPDDGVSAIHYATRFAAFLLDCAKEMKEAAAKDDNANPFTPPYDTINIGVINGGAAKNIIAGKCEMLWLYRALPEHNVADFIGKTDRYINEVLLPQMRAAGHPADIDNRRMASYPGLIPDGNSPAVQLAMQLINTDKWQTAPFGADAGQFAEDGIPTVIIGPGDIGYAHKPNEQINTADLSECLTFLDRLRATMSS